MCPNQKPASEVESAVPPLNGPTRHGPRCTVQRLALRARSGSRESGPGEGRGGGPYCLARHEAASGRLDAAARAAGLAARGHAADLAVLAATIPTKARPALFGFLPLDAQPPGPWLLDVFGDDLAWVAGLELPRADSPMPRELHTLWTEIFLGKRQPNDPAITALGPAAVAATNDMVKELRSDSGSGSGSGSGSD